MPLWPQEWIAPPVISSISEYSAGLYGAMASAQRVAATSTAWPSANRTLYIPFWLPGEFTVRSMFCCNGATVNGNVDLGIMTWDGTRIYSSGATAQAGTSAPQIINNTDFQLSAGQYYFALGCSSGTATFRIWADPVLVLRRIGVLQEAVGTIPATATFATAASAYLPNVGISSLDSGY